MTCPPDPGFDADASGDTWVTARDGNNYWGRYGAAGVVAFDPERGVLLQHRADWSHFGGTWGIPGGAIHREESPIAGALREAHEEAGVPIHAAHVTHTHVVDKGNWKYTTVVARVTEPFMPVMGDAESKALAWVPVDQVSSYPLHPGFEQAWPVIRELLGQPVTVIVDAANVMGAVPDGWWKDRHGAAARLRDKLDILHSLGVVPLFARFAPKDFPGVDRIYPTWVLVTEGVARTLTGTENVTVVGAQHSGDEAILEQAALASARGERVVVVTSDKELRVRVSTVGAETRGVKHLLRRLPELSTDGENNPS